jgi:superfamily II DNA or RNA helicase
MQLTGLSSPTGNRERIEVRKINASWIRVDAPTSVCYELREYFSFKVDGCEFMPKYRDGSWDGYIRVFDMWRKRMPAGHVWSLIEFAKKFDYDVEFHDGLTIQDEMSVHEAKEFCKSLNLPFPPHDHQLHAFISLVQDKRGLLLSPTSSGKSYIAYLLTQWYGDQKNLIIVPTKNLVSQMKTDFIDYGADPNTIYRRKVDKNEEARITVTTWQGIQKQPKKFYHNYGVIIGDEAHGFKAKSLSNIMENAEGVEYRFGMTGTLDGTEVNEMILVGHFGRVRQMITTKEMIDKGLASKFKVDALILRHSEEERRQMSGAKYAEELKYILKHERRNRFVKNLALSLKGNVLVMFNRIEHGEALYELMKGQGKDVHLIHGGVAAEDREAIRSLMEKSNNCITVASSGTFSTGANVRNLHHIIGCGLGKSRIRVYQTIGRSLRLATEKVLAKMYDIADDLRWKSHTNYTLKHFTERLQMYSNEEFEYKIYNINI